jgi:hypothetical protein
MLPTSAGVVKAREHSGAEPAATLSQSGLMAQADRLPLAFEPTRQVSGPGARFVSRGAAGSVLVGATQATFAPARIGAPTLRFRFAGGSASAAATPVDRLPGVVNYLIGPDASNWRTGVPTFGGVQFHGVYPGVDIAYTGRGGRLEYDLDLAPGADTGRIRLVVEGARSVVATRNGGLVARSGSETIREAPPVAFQEISGRRRTVSVRYERTGARTFSVRLGAHDPAHAVLVDPVIAYGTFLGGNHNDTPFALAVDPDGNAYLGGITNSTNYPGLGPGSIQSTGPNGPQVPFYGVITKINAAGNAIVYSTLYGGGGGDSINSIAVDATGHAFIAGTTSSATLPGIGAGSIQSTNQGLGDAFIAKLAADGSRVDYATFLGGTNGDFGTGVALDGTGDAYVAGYTMSTSFTGVGAGSLQPTVGGGNLDGFVTKINPAGSATLFSTFLGGDGAEQLWAIAVDDTGDPYLAGTTTGQTFPGVGPESLQPTNAGGPGNLDSFVTKLDATGSAILYSTFLGGAQGDTASAIAVDASGAAYVAGGTSSPAFPGVGPGSIQPVFGGGVNFADAFVTKLTPTGTGIAYSTFLGGTGPDSASSIAVDTEGDAFVTGMAGSTPFPGVGPASFATSGSWFFSKINPTGTALLYSTKLAGGNIPAVRVDPSGDAYIGGATMSSAFTGVGAGALQPVKGAGQDGVLLKIAFDHSPPVITPTVTGTLGANGFYRSDVQVSWAVTDPDSAITSSSGCSPVSITADTTGTSLTCSAVSEGGQNASTITVKRDVTPPTLTLPPDQMANATGPPGTTVPFSAIATDAIDPTPTVACVPPSGATFAIGTTLVHCTAADAAGNTASASFAVTVRGASAELGLLRTFVGALDVPGKSLDSQLAAVAAGLAAGRPDQACGVLGAFTNQARAQSGKQLTVAEANKLVADGKQIEAVIDCG